MQLQSPPTSPAEYLARELRSASKSEYVDGEIFAMAGASRRHNLLVGNLLRRALNAAPAGGPCQVFGADMRVHVEARNSFYYPAVSACCDPDDRNELFTTRPCLIIEVLSPTSAAVDRREKRLSYATLASLHEYIIVDQDRMRVHVFPRASGPWMIRTLNEPDDVVHFSCLGLHLTLQEIYAGVELPAGVAEVDAPAYAVS